jgi:hypothetical protein
MKKKHGVFIGFVVLLTTALFALGGCGDIKTARKINAFLRENGFETIRGGSKEEINGQLFDVLAEHGFGMGNGSYEEMEQRRIRFASVIVETECFDTAKKAFLSPDFLGYYFGLWAVIKTDAVPEKSPEALEFLEFFYRLIKEDETLRSIISDNFSFLKLYEEAPDVLEQFYPELVEEKELHRDGVLANAITKSSKEFKNAIIEQVSADISYAFPFSKFKETLADFKPSSPREGGYLFVFDDSEHKLYKSSDSSESFTRIVSRHDVSDYRTDILYPVVNPNDAQIIIYETYSYEKPNNYWFGYVYLLHTNVRVVHTASGRTIFNKNFRSTGDESYWYTGDYAIDNDYDSKEYAKQISEIVKRGL